ncbi:MAG: hypothetical protein AABW51_04275 [Nanoarchaeota archaeon]
MKHKTLAISLIVVIGVILILASHRNSNVSEKNLSTEPNSSINSSNFENVDEKIRCKQDSDCSWVENLSACCSTYLVTNFETISKHIDFAQIILYPENHSSAEIKNPNFDGTRICGNIRGCTTMAISTPDNITCELNKCTPHYKNIPS